MSKLKKKSDLSIMLKKIEDNDLTSQFEEGLLVYCAQGFSRDTLYGISSRLLGKYEELYIRSLNTYLHKEYRIEPGDLNSEEELNRIDTLRQDILVKLLVNFQSVFNGFKRQLNVDNFEKLRTFKKILQVNSYPLEDVRASQDDFLDFVTEVPNNLTTYFSKHDLVHGSFKKIKVRYYEDEYVQGVFFYTSRNEDTFYDNRDIDKIELLNT